MRDHVRVPDALSLVDWLQSRTREQLAELLDDVMARHPEAVTTVELAFARGAGDLTALREAVDDRMRTRRFLDWRASSEWAADAQPVLDELEAMARERPSGELVLLLQRAADHLHKVLLRVDDSNGSIGYLQRQVLDLHERVCAAGVADPRQLAKWMVAFSFDRDAFWPPDVVAYAAALGEAGLAAYRAEVDRRLPEAGEFGNVRFAHRRLAVADCDVDAIVERFGGDLSSSQRYLWVAEALREIDRDDLALDWARRGLAVEGAVPWSTDKLYDVICAILADDAVAVRQTRLEQFEKAPSSQRYALLRKAAEATGSWATDRPAALVTLGRRDIGALFDVLLGEGHDDQAWELMVANQDWDPGEDRLERLAKAREREHPGDAFDLYVRVVHRILVKADRRNYQVAVRLLRHAQKAAAAAARGDDFDALMTVLREEHRRRPSLMEMLDRFR